MPFRGSDWLLIASARGEMRRESEVEEEEEEEEEEEDGSISYHRTGVFFSENPCHGANGAIGHRL